MKHSKIAIVTLCFIAFFVASFFTKPAAISSSNTNTDVIKQNPTTIFVPSSVQAASVPPKLLEVPILMYHHVGELDGSDSVARDLTVSREDFIKQVKLLKNLGYQTVSLAEVYAALENGNQLPPKPIVFTFDDGYQDVFDNAVPVLLANGYIGSFAIATELLGRPTYAEWADVIEARNLGMEIVSHSENHLDLTSKIYSEADLEREIVGSKKLLEEKLNTKIEFFVYPYGKQNLHVEELVARAGYKMALTTAFAHEVSLPNLFITGRVRVHGVDGLARLEKIFASQKIIEPVKDTRSADVLLNP